MGEILYLLFNLFLWGWILVCLFAIAFALFLLFLLGVAIYRFVRVIRTRYCTDGTLPNRRDISD